MVLSKSSSACSLNVPPAVGPVAVTGSLAATASWGTIGVDGLSVNASERGRLLGRVDSVPERAALLRAGDEGEAVHCTKSKAFVHCINENYKLNLKRKVIQTKGSISSKIYILSTLFVLASREDITRDTSSSCVEMDSCMFWAQTQFKYLCFLHRESLHVD